MVLPSWACTRTLPWIYCHKPLLRSATASGTSKRRHVLCFRLGSWSENERRRYKHNGRLAFTASSHSTEESTAVANRRTMPELAGASCEGAGESVNAANHITGLTPACAPSAGESANVINSNTGPTPASALSTGESANATNPSSEQEPPARRGTRKQKHLSLDTYTFHALGDYVKTIGYLGTTDSYSTQSVSFS
jgi:hypothetical protein